MLTQREKMMAKSRCGHESLVELGFRLESSRDLAIAQWIVEKVGAEFARTAAQELSARRKPRPSRVARRLGLPLVDDGPFGAEFQRIPFEWVTQHASARARGWPARSHLLGPESGPD